MRPDKLTGQASIKDAAKWAVDKGEAFEIKSPTVLGFRVAVRANGGASFILRYNLNGKRKKDTLARVGTIAFAEAEKLAKRRLADVANGIDINARKKDARQAVATKERIEADTVAVIAVQWLKHYKVKRSENSHRAAKAAVNKYIVPTLGKRPMAEINVDDIRRLISSVPADKGGAARSVYAYARIFFEWAHGEGHVSSNPVAAMPKTKRPPIPKARNRFLGHDEVEAIWAASESEASEFRALFRLLIATGARLNEVAGISWAELDRTNRRWEIPAARAKNDIDHLVHLNEPAIAALDSMAGGAAWPSKGLAITTTGKTPMSHFKRAQSRITDRMATALGEVPHWRIHDLRRTFATHCGELGESDTVIELALNHKGKRAGLVGTYNAADKLPERKKMLETWGAALLEIAAGKRPTQFRDKHGEIDLDLWRAHCLNRRELWREKWGVDARRGKVAPIRAAL